MKVKRRNEKYRSEIESMYAVGARGHVAVPVSVGSIGAGKSRRSRRRTRSMHHA
jgi:hypothetical protein